MRQNYHNTLPHSDMTNGPTPKKKGHPLAALSFVPNVRLDACWFCLFVHRAPCNEEVQEVLRLDLAIAIEVWADVVGTAAVIHGCEVVEVVSFFIGATEPHT